LRPRALSNRRLKLTPPSLVVVFYFVNNTAQRRSLAAFR